MGFFLAKAKGGASTPLPDAHVITADCVTAGEVYLLLPLALALHLASENCPLILDDAVAASDSQRKRDLLETLLAVSESTQVILYTHEDDVCAWARERLAGEQHSLTELDGPER
ncbi:MAG: hypothetical protein OXF50_12795 [Caldilineaceae bacterium]|nr:hypothetical protein [Caldilineaceae bacterium]